MTKRANGQGSISKRKNGTYMGQISINRFGPPEKTIRKTVYGKTKKEVEKKLIDLKYEINNNLYIEDRGITVLNWMKTWIEEIKKENIRISSLKRYSICIKNHINPYIGSMKLKDIKPIHITQLYNELLKNGNIRTGKSLNPKTVRFAHIIICEALDAAVANGILRGNLAKHVNAPKIIKKEMTFLSKEEVAKFLDVAKETRLYSAYYLMLATGMRRGELLGLRYEDVDYQNKSISIVQTLLNNAHEKNEEGKLKAYVFGIPKTEKSRRTISITENVLVELKKFRKIQMSEELESLEYKNEFQLLFTDSNGAPIKPDKFSYEFTTLIKKAGIKRNIRLHDLRHTVASYLLNETDANPKTVQELLGHTTITTTLDTYSHINQSKKKELANELDNLVNNN